MRKVIVSIALGVAMAPGPAIPAATVTAISTDGEATAYVTGDFRGNFDLRYRARLARAPKNRSWSTVGVMLLGTVNPGPSVEVGLANGDPDGKTIVAFTSANYPGGRSSYAVAKANCGEGCLIELRGTASSIEALIDDVRVKSWARRSVPLTRPYVQLNAEVDREGDSIVAVLEPLETTANSRRLTSPRCAFTTRGITAAGTDTIAFHGTNRSAAPVTYVTLATGVYGTRCH